MERKDYLALVHREVTVLLDEREALVRAAARDPAASEELDRTLEAQVSEILAEVDHLEDVLKWSGLAEPDAALWREADSWRGVLIGAAMAALVHDVRSCAARVLAGEIPRPRNVQFTPRAH
jgi:hypothetical protein